MRILNLSRAKLRVSLLVLFAGLAALAPLQPTATLAGAPPQTIKGSIHYTWRGPGVARSGIGTSIILGSAFNVEFGNMLLEMGRRVRMITKLPLLADRSDIQDVNKMLESVYIPDLAQLPIEASYVADLEVTLEQQGRNKYVLKSGQINWNYHNLLDLALPGKSGGLDHKFHDEFTGSGSMELTPDNSGLTLSFDGKSSPPTMKLQGDISHPMPFEGTGTWDVEPGVMQMRVDVKKDGTMIWSLNALGNSGSEEPYRGSVETQFLNLNLTATADSLRGSQTWRGPVGTQFAVEYDFTGECAVEITRPEPNAKWTFDESQPGVIQGKVAAWVEPFSLSNRLEWTFPEIPGSKLTTQPSPARGPEVEFKYEKLPDKNSAFGKKELGVKVSSGSYACSSTLPVRVFFPRDAQNNPGIEGAKVPNWFYYWKQTSAASDHTGDSIRYRGRVGICSDSYGYYAGFNNPHEQDWIYVCDLKQVNFKDNSPIIYSIRPLLKPPGYKIIDGIDVFGVTVIHEWTHLTKFKEWWSYSDGTLTEYRPNTNSCNYPPPTDPQQLPRYRRDCACKLGLAERPPLDGREKYDCDRDRVPDFYEPDLGLSPNLPDTCELGYGDSECVAYVAENNWKVGTADKEDWACPGKQSEGSMCEGAP